MLDLMSSYNMKHITFKYAVYAHSIVTTFTYPGNCYVDDALTYFQPMVVQTLVYTVGSILNNNQLFGDI